MNTISQELAGGLPPLVAPPPMRVGGMLLVYEAAESKKQCTFACEDDADTLAYGSLMQRLRFRLNLVSRFSEDDRNAILELFEGLVGGVFTDAVSVVRKYEDDPRRLQIYRDALAELLRQIGVRDVEILLTGSFRVRVGNAVTDAVNVVVRESQTGLVIGIPSHSSRAVQIFRWNELPDGSSVMEPETNHNVEELFSRVAASFAA